MQNRANPQSATRRRVKTAPVPARRRFGLKRLFVITTIVGVTTLMVYLFFATGSAALTREWARERLVNLAGNSGYRLQNLYVQGRHHTDPDVLRGLINMEKGDPLFAFDPETARDLLLRVSWIKDVNVRREMPDTIYINLTERTPIALWQHDGKVRVIDADGVILTADYRSFSSLPLVVGAGANKRAAELLALLQAEPELKKRIVTASWIGERRWDLTAKNGLVIKMPENDLGLAFKKLSDSQTQDQLLEKDVALIDLREADRLVVRTRPGAVQEYKASFKPGEKDL